MEENETLDPIAQDASLQGDNGNEGSETPVETPQFMTVADWEARERTLKDEFEQRLQAQARAAQSVADKKRISAQRKQEQLLKETVPMLKNAGVDLDDDTVARMANNIREQEFWSPEPTQTEETAQKNYVTRASLEAYLNKRGLASKAINLDKYVGIPDDDPAGANFYQEVNAAVEKSKQDAVIAENARKVADARRVVETKNNFGGTATPSGTNGTANTAVGLQSEMSELLKKVPSNHEERSEIKRRMNEIEQELKKQGQWGPQK